MAKVSTLDTNQIAKVQLYWRNRDDFLGFPDAERDSLNLSWFDDLLVHPNWFDRASTRSTTAIVGRKGSGKSAVRIAAARTLASASDCYVVQTSADELVSRYAPRLEESARRGFGAVPDWCFLYADVVARTIAASLKGKLVLNDDEALLRKLSVLEGITERDFGERLASVVSSLLPWARGLSGEQAIPNDVEALFRRVSTANAFALFIDDFDNIQEGASSVTTRLIRDAIEAADRITSVNPAASVHLLMREDLWLRIEPGWHYADKVAGIAHLSWTQDDLRKWADRRLRYAVAVALGNSPDEIELSFDRNWNLFFPEKIHLRDNDRESSGLHYVIRRTMYTPRGLRRFMRLIADRGTAFPADQRAVEDAEDEFSVDQLSFLKTEFAGICEGLDVCLESFTGRTRPWVPNELYKHLRGLLGTGQVRLNDGGPREDPVALARFLFRIGFLEVRYPDPRDGQLDRFEVRDAMRHPDHWKSIRSDDAVRWAVRSAFYCALRAHS